MIVCGKDSETVIEPIGLASGAGILTQQRTLSVEQTSAADGLVIRSLPSQAAATQQDRDPAAPGIVLQCDFYQHGQRC